MKVVHGYHSIKIKGSYPIKQLKDIQIVQEINNHFTMHLSGILQEEEAENFIYKVSSEDAIEVALQEDSEIVIFSGIPTAINLKSVHGINYIALNCKSCTYNMDVSQCSRSFQDKKMTFDQLIEFIVSGYEDGYFINTAASEKKIGKIRVQYKETDWEFLKRIASSEETVLVPDISIAKSRFWFGMPKSKKTIEVDPQESLSFAQKNETVKENERCCYELELQEYLNIGDTVKVNNIPFAVTKTLIYMKNGVLLFRYRLQEPDSIKTKAIENKKLQGVSLPGTVIDVARNQLKVHLDIDPKQEVEKAHWFPYSAEANNVWYSMPQKGTKINVYFPGAEAKQAMAMASTRGCGEEMQKNPNMSKPTEKVMETKWGKELRLKEDHINFDTGLMNVKLDEKSIEVVSNDKIVITSDTDLNIGKTVTKAVIDGKETEIVKESKNISIITDELVTLKVNNTKSAIELEINNNLASRLKLNMDGTFKAAMPMLTSAGQQQKKQAEEAAKAEEERQKALQERKKVGLGKLIGAAALAIGAVAAVAAFTVLTGGAGPMIAAGVAVSLGGSAAALSIGSAAVAVATFVTGATAVGLVGAATAEALEGIDDIRLAYKGDLETKAFNPMRDRLLAGNEELYAGLKEGLMFLATIESIIVEPFAPFVCLTASQANQRNMRTFQIPNPKNLFGPQYNGSGTLVYAPPIVVSVPAVNVSGVAGAISAEQMMQLSMMQSGGGSGYSSGGGSDQGGNGSNQGNVAPKTLDEMKPDELKELTPEQLDEMKPEGWKFNQSPDGRFVHIKDSNNNYRIRIDPPDKVTPYRHIHIYDADGNALDINGNIVPKSSPDAHIPYNNI